MYAAGVLVRRGLTVAAAIGFVSCLAACGSGSSTSSASDHGRELRPQSSPARTSRSPATRPHPQPHVGSTQRIHTSGTTLSVTVSRVIDPLLGSGAALVPGTRAAGVVIRIYNDGPGIYDSSATGDVSLVPSSGPVTPVFAAHGICQTPLRDFDNYISAGEMRQGCVALAISAGARVGAVRFSPHGQPPGRAWLATR